MANRIIYKPQGTLLSSAIGDLSVAVDGTYIDVSLTGWGGIVVLSERYYAYGGTVTLCDLGSLIEEDMRSSGLSYADYTLSVYTDTPGNNADSCVLHILYCDRFSVCTYVPRFLSENFLTTLSMRRIAPNTTVSLFLFANAGESIEYRVDFLYRLKGSDEILSDYRICDAGKTATAAGVCQINISLSEQVNAAADYHRVPRSEVTILQVIVTLGQRSATLFVGPALRSDLSALSFYFRNMFNVWEEATFPAVTTAKTGVDRSIALINGRSEFYNQSVGKSYEVETAALTADEAEWIDQLFTSHEVFRIEDNAIDDTEPYIMAHVLITDSTCEVQNGDEKLNRVKFTWRYADNRPIVRLSASPGIFSSPYDITYS